MQYRDFTNMDYRASALGFGTMRLPETDEKTIDEAQALAMLRHGIDSGVNYIDTAWMYHDGASEGFVGRALQDGYREKVKIATKLPVWEVHEQSDCERIFNTQLERLQVEHVDFYLLHALDQKKWEMVKEHKMLEWAEREVSAGRIKHLGFSFHDSTEVLKQIITEYDHWEFCQVQYNYMDVKHQAGTDGVKYAADKGLGVIVMEPLRGGKLAAEPPQVVKDIWAESGNERSSVDWALQWIWSQPEVSIVLSGMSNMEQVKQNLESAAVSGVGSMSAADLKLVDRVREAYKLVAPISCTSCGYCMPCPAGIDIPRVLDIYNNSFVYGDAEASRGQYKWIEGADMVRKCTECGQCESICPQGLAVIELLKKADEYLKG